MRIKLLTVLAGPAGIMQPGVHDVPAQQAQELIRAGAALALDTAPPVTAEEAVEVKAPAAVETARRNPPEKALSRRGKALPVSGGQ